MANAKPAKVAPEAPQPEAPKADPRRPNPEAEVTTMAKPKKVTKVGETTIEDY